MCQEPSKPRERSPSCFRVSGGGIWLQVRPVIYGTKRRDRTAHAQIFNLPLYRLSYPGIVWYGWRDSNSQNPDFESDTYTNSVTSA